VWSINGTDSVQILRRIRPNDSGSGSSSVAKIDFGSSGTKRLLLRYSPVVKL